MTRLFKYLSAYMMWLVDLGLAFWLVLLLRTTYLTIFAAFYEPGGWAYTQRVGFADKAFILILGLGWLIFMIVAEAYFRRSAILDGLFGRFTRITGPLLLCVFSVDLLLFWLQGGGDWRRWLILVAELSLGLLLVVYTRSHQTPSPARRFST